MRENNRSSIERFRASAVLVKTLYALVLIIAVLCAPGVYADQARPNATIPAEQSLWRFMCPAHTGIGTIKNGTIIMVNEYVIRAAWLQQAGTAGAG